MNVTIDGNEVDMKPEDSPGFTYAIADPLKPGSVSGTTSTTFPFPATNRNRQALGSETMTEHPPTDDPELRIANYGQTYVKSKIRPIEWDREEIRATAVGNNASWLQDIKDTKINEMGWGESRRIERIYQQATWTDEDDLLYFPLIDYGKGWNAGVTAGSEDLRPGMRCHRILKKAFGDLGYSINVKGSLRGVWKKYVLPCVNDIVIGESFLGGNKVILTQGALQSTNTTNTSNPVRIPVNLTSVYDPGGNIVSTNVYVAPFDLRAVARFGLAIKVNNATPVPLTKFKFALFNATTGQAVTPYYITPLLSPSSGFYYVNYDTALGEVDLLAGQPYVVGVQVTQTTVDLEIQAAIVSITPINIEYQENVTIDIDACAPKKTAWDVLSAIHYLRFLAIDTDDNTKTVTISYYDEKYRPTFEGRSLVGREDHTKPPQKKDPLKAKNIRWQWGDDSNDLILTELNSRIGSRGWGGHVETIPKGVLKEEAVKVPFSATAMHSYTGSVFIPVMRETHVGSTDETRFTWAPRLLIANGVTDGDWTFNGSPYTFYPQCGFVFPGSPDLSLSFHPEEFYGDSGPGMVALHGSGFLRRYINSKFLSISLTLYDDELVGMDLGIPVEVNDGKTNGWYYITKIDQKRYGLPQSTPCELQQV